MTYPFGHRVLTKDDKAVLLEWAEPYARGVRLTASGLADLYDLVGELIAARTREEP